MTDQKNYTSKVPYFTLPKTIEKQGAALKSNPLLQRLFNYRKRYFYDPHRPIYHMSTQKIYLMILMDSVIGKGDGIYFIRVTRQKIHASIGGMPSVMI